MSVPTPAVPASTVAQVNATGQYVVVTITGGTLTFVFVNGVQVGTTAGSYAVPPGGTISITYSVAPTWAWTNPPATSYSPGYSGYNTLAEGAGYNPLTLMPYAQHAEGGFTNLGTGVSN
jgi:hypothetical protein